MRVSHLSLRDFRNYREAEVAFHPGLNLIVGRNGQGKTNLVEAIAYFATLGSHRVTGDAALIRAGTDSAVSRLRIAAREREVLLEIQVNRGSPNRAQLNRNRVQPRELPRWCSTVMFAPEDLSIVRGDPARRRSFLDEAVIALNPTMIGVLADFDRVVRQRTSLLKSARGSGSRQALDATLPVWDEQLISLGTRIIWERRSIVHQLGAPLAAAYRALVGEDHGPELAMAESIMRTIDDDDVSRETPPGEKPGDEGVSRETISDHYRASLEAVRAQERERGVTLVGPHRDDVVLQLNDLPVKGYASHGESWSYAVSLRLALAQLIRQESPTGDPVIILDDVFAELDTRRRSQLLSAVEGFEQVIVTAAVEEDIPEGRPWHRIAVIAGTIAEPTDGVA